MRTRRRPSADTTKLKRRLLRRLVALAVLFVVAGGVLAAVPGLHGVDRRLGEITAGWILLAVALKLLSGHGYVLSCARGLPARAAEVLPAPTVVPLRRPAPSTCVCAGSASRRDPARTVLRRARGGSRRDRRWSARLVSRLPLGLDRLLVRLSGDGSTLRSSVSLRVGPRRYAGSCARPRSATG
jgi:hypothetical protein